MGNKLVIGLVAGLIVLALIIGVVASDDQSEIPSIAEDESTEGSADADTTVNTLETLVARIKAGEEQRIEDRNLLLAQQETINKLNARLQIIDGESSDVDIGTIKEDILAEVIDEVGKLSPNQGGDGAWGSDFDEFDGDLDIGNGTNSAGTSSAAGRSQVISNSSDDMVVLGAVSIKQASSQADISRDREGVQDYIGNKESKDDNYEEDFNLDSTGQTEESSKGVPLYTIPQLAQDINAETLTAVIGRIPNGGEIRDPFYFKVISSADIITANGHQLPDLEGIIWEGTAIGDRTLSCIQGSLTKVSLVLTDGSIAETNIGGSNGGGDNASIGYIADKYGQPCLPGKLISNAGKLLFARVSARALEAAAEADAARQETTSSNPATDTTTTTVNGSRSSYIRSKTASGGMSELVAFTRERMRDAFDAIYAEPGVTVQVHLRQQLEFNFNDKGRQLVHNNGGKLDASILAD